MVFTGWYDDDGVGHLFTLFNILDKRHGRRPRLSVRFLRRVDYYDPVSYRIFAHRFEPLASVVAENQRLSERSIYFSS